MSETPQKTHHENTLHFNEGETLFIKETDWTNKTLEEMRRGLVERIKAGFVLHGSQARFNVLHPHESFDGTEYKNRVVTAVFATDRPLMAIFRAAFGVHLQQWGQAAFFQIDESSNLENSVGYIYLGNAADFFHDLIDVSEYISNDPVIPVERIAISGRELVRFLRTQDQVATDFIDGDLSGKNILPEKVRVEDCVLVIMNIISFLERMDYWDYSYDFFTEKGEKLRALLERLTILLDFYQIVLKSDAMKDETLVPFIRRAKRLCYEKTHGMYDTFDPVIMNLAQSVISSVEDL